MFDSPASNPFEFRSGTQFVVVLVLVSVAGIWYLVPGCWLLVVGSSSFLACAHLIEISQHAHWPPFDALFSTHYALVLSENFN